MARLSPQERRDAIVDATLRVARVKGLGATTVRDVAGEMGCSSGLIHHYFDSMDDVLATAFEQAAGRDLERAIKTLAVDLDPLARLDAFVRCYSPAQSDWTMQLWLDAWAEASRRPAVQEVSRRLNLAWHSVVRDIVVDGVEAGCFRTGDADATAWRLLSMLDGLALQVVAHGTLISRDDVVAWSAEAARRELDIAVEVEAR